MVSEDSDSSNLGRVLSSRRRGRGRGMRGVDSGRKGTDPEGADMSLRSRSRKAHDAGDADITVANSDIDDMGGDASERYVEDAHDNGDMDTARHLLARSKRLLKRGKLRQSAKLAQEAEAMARKARNTHYEIIDDIQDLEDEIIDLKDMGFNIKKANEFLAKAKKSLIDVRYSNARELMNVAHDALEKAQFIPFPLLQKNIIIKTIVGYEEHNILLKVRVENHMDETLGEIMLKPSIPQDMFAPIPSQMIGVLEGMQAKEIIFRLSPIIDNWELGVPGKLIQGKDVTVKTILGCKYGEATYKVRIENNKSRPLYDVTVKPAVPPGLEPDAWAKTIPEIPPMDATTILFELTPKRVSDAGKSSRDDHEYVDEAEGDEVIADWDSEDDGEGGETEPGHEVDFDEKELLEVLEAETTGFAPIGQEKREMAYMPNFMREFPHRYD